MRWISALRAELPLSDAAGELVGELTRELGGDKADLLLVFGSPHYGAGLRALGRLLREAFDGPALIGCSGSGVVGNGLEVEGRPAVSVTAAVLPGVEIDTFHVGTDALPGPVADVSTWQALFGVAPEADPQFILLSDPFSLDVQLLLQGLDAAYPMSPKVGGLASGAREAGGNTLLIDDDFYDSGAVGIALTGNIVVDTVIAQGCRPVGEPMFVTGCDGHMLFTIDGKPALHSLEALYEGLAPAEQQLARHSLFVGLGMDAPDDCYVAGDFLIRNLIGTDPRTGALAVGAMLDEGAVVQFHLRDAETSAEDLRNLLERYLRQRAEARGAAPAGVLLFSCLGRGERLYGEPHHDSRLLQRHLGELAIGGFFCNGEIGPVKGRTYLHGYTSAVGIVRTRDEA